MILLIHEDVANADFLKWQIICYVKQNTTCTLSALTINCRQPNIPVTMYE